MNLLSSIFLFLIIFSSSCMERKAQSTPGNCCRRTLGICGVCLGEGLVCSEFVKGAYLGMGGDTRNVLFGLAFACISCPLLVEKGLLHKRQKME